VQLIQSRSTPSTIDIAREWVLKNIPAGSKIVIEYGAFRLPSQYQTVGSRLLIARTIDQYRSDAVDYFVAAAPEHQQVLKNPGADPDLTGRYRALLSSTQEVAAFDPTGEVIGPPIRIFHLVK
jgi:hypothetical protein